MHRQCGQVIIVAIVGIRLLCFASVLLGALLGFYVVGSGRRECRGLAFGGVGGRRRRQAVEARLHVMQAERRVGVERQVQIAVPGEGIRDVYESVHAAIVDRRALLCKYESVDGPRRGKDPGEWFDLEPYTLFFSQRAWYVLGHHDGRGKVRRLKLNRFGAIEPTHRRYKIPTDFTVNRHLGNAWRMIRGDKSYEIELWFDADFAETISDTHWHDTQQIDWHDDGSITFRCTVDGLDEIVWWVLSMGPHCVVRKPKTLVTRVRKLAEGVVAQYAGTRKPKTSRPDPA